MTIKDGIATVQKSGYDSEKIRSLFSLDLAGGYTYGKWICLIKEVCLDLMKKQTNDPQNFTGSEDEKMLHQIFEWEELTAEMIGIDPDHLSDFNCYLLEHNCDLINEYLPSLWDEDNEAH